MTNLAVARRAKTILRTGCFLAAITALVHRGNLMNMSAESVQTRQLSRHKQPHLPKIDTDMSISIANDRSGHQGSLLKGNPSYNSAQTEMSSVADVHADTSRIGKKKSRRRKGGRAEINITVKNAEKTNLPPLDSLIGDLQENVTGNVQSLLDFAVVGFGKCGTTALINWLDGHPEINTIPKEACHLSRQRPALMVQKLYQMKVDSILEYEEKQQSTAENRTMVGRIQGFKNPSDIRRPEAMIYLRQHWPKTKLIVTVRHPVHWFRSLYNFLLNEMGRSKSFLHHNSLIGGPHKNTAYAHTGKGEFHAILSLLGKTAMNTDDELDLLKGFLREDEILNWPRPLPNKIFFLDRTQMSDKNATRVALFRRDLQNFLGLEQPLPPVPHVRPGKDRKIDESLKIDLCKPENDETRQELLRISQNASLWFRNFFLESEDVFVSSRDYLQEIFATKWMQDPCNE